MSSDTVASVPSHILLARSLDASQRATADPTRPDPVLSATPDDDRQPSRYQRRQSPRPDGRGRARDRLASGRGRRRGRPGGSDRAGRGGRRRRREGQGQGERGASSARRSSRRRRSSGSPTRCDVPGSGWPAGRASERATERAMKGGSADPLFGAGWPVVRRSFSEPSLLLSMRTRTTRTKTRMRTRTRTTR